MSYEITIGEKTLNSSRRIEAKTVTLENAPAFGEPTDFTNERWPSYSGWANFCRNANIPQYWIITTHPGYVKLTKSLHKDLNEKYIEYKLKYPNATACFDGNENNANLARFEWLIFWVDWAINNCNNPIITNT